MWLALRPATDEFHCTIVNKDPMLGVVLAIPQRKGCREVASVFDTTEPFARELARNGRMHGSRQSILKNIGNALLVRHRVSGPVEVEEKPDVLWDKPHLERLYARLEDEYELKERAESLNRKLAVIAESAQVLTDIIDTRRSLRLEVIIVLLILFEVIITIYQLAVGRHV